MPGWLWPSLLVSAVVTLPLTVFLFIYYIKGLTDASATKLGRFVSFCVPALFLLILLVGWTMSFDLVKWLCHANVISLAAFMYMLYNEKDVPVRYARGVFSRIPAPLVTVYGVAYASVVMPFFNKGAMK